MKDTIPKYIQIADFIKSEIENGSYKDADKLPSEAELMEMFSVSRIVVVNALRKLTSEGTIFRVAGKGSFVSTQNKANKPVQNCKYKYRHILLIISGIIDYYSSSIASELLNECYNRSILCSIAYSFNNNKLESDIIDYAINSDIDGIILYPCDKEIYSTPLLNAIEKNLPVVLIDHDLPGLGLSCISTDNELATRLATSHLLNLGHQKICLFSRVPMPTMSITERTNGFIFEMKAQNKLIDPSLILTNASEEELNTELDNVIKNKLSTAFLCLSLHDFHIVYDTICRNGYKCPEDFSIVHFDRDSTILPSQSITTHIVQDSKEISIRAVDILDRMLNSGTNICEKINVAPILIEGCTTSII